MMDVVKLGQRQLFGMKKENLMKRVAKYFEQTENAPQVVEFLIAILVRDALCVGDYSLGSLAGLIQQVFLTAEPTDTLRKQCVLFQTFFSKKDWQTVIDRLFNNKAEYHEFTKETCKYRALLIKKQQEKPETSEFQFNIVSTFKDASGKKHKWTLRDTKEIPENAPNEAAEVAEVLEILTTLTIFQSSNGTRRFAEFLDYISFLSRINVKYEATATHSESEALVQAHLSDTDSKPTPTASIHLNKKPQEPANTGSSETERNKPFGYDPIAAKVDAMYPLPGETPPTQLKSCSAAPNPAVTEKTPTKKTPDILQKSDTSYLRYGKTEEQIKKDRDAKKKQQKIARALGRKGRKKK